MYRKYLIDKELYMRAKDRYTELWNKKQLEFDKTQPSAMKFEGERVSGGQHNNKWDSYIDKMLELDPEIKALEEIMKGRRIILDLSEQDLRKSTNTQDMIFVARYLERKKIYKITAIVNYSERQVWRYLREIQENIKKIKDGTL